MRQEHEPLLAREGSDLDLREAMTAKARRGVEVGCDLRTSSARSPLPHGVVTDRPSGMRREISFVAWMTVVSSRHRPSSLSIGGREVSVGSRERSVAGEGR